MTYIKSNLLKSEWIKRLLNIAATATRWMLLPLLNILISKSLIDWKGEDFWGEFYGDFLYVMLFAHLAGYGNRDFLLREINANLQNANNLWQECLLNRSLLLLPMIVFFCWSKPSFEASFLLIAWTISTFLLQSFDVWVVYQKKFQQNLIIELIGFVILIVGIYLKKENINLIDLYRFYFFTQLLKSILFIFLFRSSLFHQFLPLHFRFSYYFQDGFFFFLLALFGLLSSRSDIYLLKTLVLPKELARYQVISNLYLQVQTFAGLIVLNFAQEIYHFSKRQLLMLSGKLFLAGIGINILASALIYLLISYYYRIIFDWDYYLLATLSCLPVYLYSPIIYSFFKAKKERIILLSQAVTIFAICLLTYLFVPFWGIKGAFMANLIAQSGLAIFYIGKEKYS